MHIHCLILCSWCICALFTEKDFDFRVRNCELFGQMYCVFFSLRKIWVRNFAIAHYSYVPYITVLLSSCTRAYSTSSSYSYPYTTSITIWSKKTPNNLAFWMCINQKVEWGSVWETCWILRPWISSNLSHPIQFFFNQWFFLFYYQSWLPKSEPQVGSCNCSSKTSKKKHVKKEEAMPVTSSLSLWTFLQSSMFIFQSCILQIIYNTTLYWL